VPDTILEIPVDPYDGQRMRYNHSKGIIYSVGEDLEDSCGSTKLLPHKAPKTQRQRQWKTEDFVFAVQEQIEQPESTVPSEAASTSDEIR
jgi:hypothetical protein